MFVSGWGWWGGDRVMSREVWNIRWGFAIVVANPQNTKETSNMNAQQNPLKQVREMFIHWYCFSKVEYSLFWQAGGAELKMFFFQTGPWQRKSEKHWAYWSSCIAWMMWPRLQTVRETVDPLIPSVRGDNERKWIDGWIENNNKLNYSFSNHRLGGR